MLPRRACAGARSGRARHPRRDAKLALRAAGARRERDQSRSRAVAALAARFALLHRVLRAVGVLTERGAVRRHRLQFEVLHAARFVARGAFGLTNQLGAIGVALSQRATRPESTSLVARILELLRRSARRLARIGDQIAAANDGGDEGEDERTEGAERRWCKR